MGSAGAMAAISVWSAMKAKQRSAEAGLGKERRGRFYSKSSLNFANEKRPWGLEFHNSENSVSLMDLWRPI